MAEFILRINLVFFRIFSHQTDYPLIDLSNLILAAQDRQIWLLAITATHTDVFARAIHRQFSDAVLLPLLHFLDGQFVAGLKLLILRWMLQVALVKLLNVLIQILQPCIKHRITVVALLEDLRVHQVVECSAVAGQLVHIFLADALHDILRVANHHFFRFSRHKLKWSVLRVLRKNWYCLSVEAGVLGRHLHRLFLVRIDDLPLEHNFYVLIRVTLVNASKQTLNVLVLLLLLLPLIVRIGHRRFLNHLLHFVGLLQITTLQRQAGRRLNPAIVDCRAVVHLRWTNGCRLIRRQVLLALNRTIRIRVVRSILIVLPRIRVARMVLIFCIFATLQILMRIKLLIYLAGR
jgi:hypothetical protein